ncbi:MAG: hypothetical protein ABIS17_16100 [Casimicrobiaceae bacterium]
MPATTPTTSGTVTQLIANLYNAEAGRTSWGVALLPLVEMLDL